MNNRVGKIYTMQIVRVERVNVDGTIDVTPKIRDSDTRNIIHNVHVAVIRGGYSWIIPSIKVGDFGMVFTSKFPLEGTLRGKHIEQRDSLDRGSFSRQDCIYFGSFMFGEAVPDPEFNMYSELFLQQNIQITPKNGLIWSDGVDTWNQSSGHIGAINGGPNGLYSVEVINVDTPHLLTTYNVTEYTNANPVDVSMPPIGPTLLIGTNHTIKRMTGAGVITIKGNGNALETGVPDIAMVLAREFVTLVYDGVQWIIIGRGQL